MFKVSYGQEVEQGSRACPSAKKANASWAASTASRSRAAILQHSGRPHLDTGPSLGLPGTGQTDKLGQAQQW